MRFEIIRHDLRRDQNLPDFPIIFSRVQRLCICPHGESVCFHDAQHALATHNQRITKRENRIETLEPSWICGIMEAEKVGGSFVFVQIQNLLLMYGVILLVLFSRRGC
jgi:hypothetical protein